jgi:RimJ/RimL family protein N-acetyltransferase
MTMWITTPQLTLIPSELAMARAELFDRPAFARLLGARVPENWPPETAADALPWFLERLEADAANFGWLAWYALCNRLPQERVLIGGIGFKGAPGPDSTVEVGYSVLPQFQRQGYARQMLSGILGWAFAQPAVVRVVADTMPSNTASVRLLERQGFRQVGPGTEPGSVLFEKLRSGTTFPGATTAPSGVRL